MFLNFFSFEKKKFNSAASRNIFYLKIKFNLINFQKKLIFFKKWFSGRNHLGRITHFKKKSLLLKKNKININYNYRYSNLGIISNFFHIPFLNKILILIYFENGSLMYINSNQFIKIFSYFIFFKKKLKLFKFNFFFFFLFQIKKLTQVSLLELYPLKNSQYVKSAGTSAKIINFNKLNHTVLLELPSSKKKLFSSYSISFLGKNNFRFANKIKNTKSGFWRIFGIKSTVRGVAKNPVDHPHGGRTKSIKFQKTPWGKVTKYK